MKCCYGYYSVCDWSNVLFSDQSKQILSSSHWFWSKSPPLIGPSTQPKHCVRNNGFDENTRGEIILEANRCPVYFVQSYSCQVYTNQRTIELSAALNQMNLATEISELFMVHADRLANAIDILSGADTGFQSGGREIFQEQNFSQELGTKFKKKGTKLTK